MHIVLFVLGIVMAIGAWSWRAQMAARGVRGAVDAAKTVANLPRRLSFMRKTGKTGLGLVEDPRDAAAILLIEIARADGEITTSQRSEILRQLSSTMGLSDTDAEETFVNASWLARDVPPPQTVFAKLSTLIKSSNLIREKELHQLDEMLVTVATVDSEISSAQQALLDEFRKQTS